MPPGPLDVDELLRSTVRVAARGRNLARGGFLYSREALRVMAGRSQISAERGDWRFADPTWDENPVYRRPRGTAVHTVDARGRVTDDPRVHSASFGVTLLDFDVPRP